VVANLFKAAASPKPAKLISIARSFVFVVLGIIIYRSDSQKKGGVFYLLKPNRQSSATVWYAAAENTLLVL
jgi:hypothetical protein